MESTLTKIYSFNDAVEFEILDTSCNLFENNCQIAIPKPLPCVEIYL